LDTGCSNHMTGKKSWFSELDDSVNRKIRFADNSIVCAAGIGKVLIHRKDGKKACITDVLYVANMRSNLISIGQLLQKGYTMKVEAQTMKVFDIKNRLILKAPLSKQRTFKINISVIEDKCLLSEVKSENWLWHQRYGHINFRNLNMLSEKKMVQGLPKIKLPNEVCDMCCTGKQARNSYNATVPFNATRKLEVIHSDVCGPFEVKSIGENRYFVTFIDEFTRKLWIYLLAKKGEVFGVFKKFRLLLQNENGEVISRLRTDGGGEYTSTEFNDFCSSNGINHEVTAPYTPQHNGISKRKNRTLVNMIRSMLKQKQMPHYLWGEAAATAAYLINISPTKKLQDKTPEEAWCGVKPSVQHLKIFGSLCFKHVPDQLRRKLDDKSQVMIMVGYHSTGAYKLYDPNNKKIVFNKDVKFDETKCRN